MAVLIKDIQRNGNEIIRIEVSEFKGRELINIRIWYQTIIGGEVVYKPTQKGVTLNINEFSQLKEGIDKLEAFIKDKESGSIPEQPVDINIETSEDEKKEKSQDEESKEQTNG